MAQNSKGPALIGRIAVQLKMISMEQLNAATREQARDGGDRKLGQILLDLGFIDAAQHQKLQTVQQQVVEKHRAKQAAAGGPVPERPPRPRDPRAEPERPPSETAPAARPAAASVAPVAPARASVQLVPAEAQPLRPIPASQTGAAAEVGTGGDDRLDLVIPEPGAEDRSRLEALLRRAVEGGASDIHLHSGAPVRVRLAGQLTHMEPTVVERDIAERMVAAALDDDQRAQLVATGERDFCFDIPGVGRFRSNAYRQQRGFDVVFRSIPFAPPSLEQLQLPSDLAKYTNYHQGMVLVTGPAGCGKSSTLAAFVNMINEEREEHILTIEDPIEVVHPSKRCLVNQRHAGQHTASFARALRGALREDPDVIVIGELRDLETISLAMTAAETGHFVLATLHTNNAVRTISRMIGAFPSNQQSQVRTMLSESLRAVISQRLVPTADESGRIPALEVLVITKAIGNLIREGKTIQIRSSMQTGRNQGMYLLEQSLNQLVLEKKITRETALAYAEDTNQITAS